MVRLDMEPDGIVVLRFLQPYAEGDEQDYLDALERLAAIERPFALLTLFGGGPALSPAGERAQALWFKRSRAGMEKHCRACAIVRPTASEEMAAVFRKLWSFPLIASKDETQARLFLHDVLGAGEGAQ